MLKRILGLGMLLLALPLWGQRSDILLEDGWRFHRGDISDVCGDDSAWETVSVPHDWAIFGPFSRDNDLQVVQVTQNFETSATEHTGRSGGLPYVGVGWYRRTLEIPEGKRAELVFDGAMSEARVYVNGTQACFWPYGYNSFHCDITALVHPGENTLAVRLENRPNSSRWYPGAGLYRDVHLVLTEKVHVPVWGTQVLTPHVEKNFATVELRTSLEGADSLTVTVATEIIAPDGAAVAGLTSRVRMLHGTPVVQNITVPAPQLWSPETPSLYKAVSRILVDGLLADTYETVFGIRTLAFIPHKGFYLNGQRRKFQGVCNHHDLGPLGAAVNESALRRQLTMLKDMGCDAVRTSHNMPAPQLVRLCDEMGLMMMVEPFDEWDVAKCENGYHRWFSEWAERDMVNMLRQYRNHPSVVLWSIGNEVPTQCSPDGYRVASFLQDICHREDPTRPVTCGMDQVDCVLDNGFAAALDIPGLNYRTFRYLEAYERLPQGFVLGSETVSTVSSRGIYKRPAEKRFSAVDPDHQCSAYDLDACWWSNIPDVDLALAEDYEWTLGQFVWTGFDYLGEPSPYDTDAWPNHSSMFGIIDLASIPKDRYYLYRSVWNRTSPTLHLLPHWNWKKGDEVPVFVYTSWPEAELFLNGKSLGRRSKAASAPLTLGGQKEDLEGRYRLRWDVAYAPGELKVVAYDAAGKPVAEESVRTAGKPHHLLLEADRTTLSADGKDLAYVTVSVVDKDGNLCPLDSRELHFSVEGAGSYRASANGDPTCLDLFHEPHMHAFAGRLTVLVQSGRTPGEALLKVSGKGIKTSTLKLNVL